MFRLICRLCIGVYFSLCYPYADICLERENGIRSKMWLRVNGIKLSRNTGRLDRYAFILLLCNLFVQRRLKIFFLSTYRLDAYYCLCHLLAHESINYTVPTTVMSSCSRFSRVYSWIPKLPWNICFWFYKLVEMQGLLTGLGKGINIKLTMYLLSPNYFSEIFIKYYFLDAVNE